MVLEVPLCVAKAQAKTTHFFLTSCQGVSRQLKSNFNFFDSLHKKENEDLISHAHFWDENENLGPHEEVMVKVLKQKQIWAKKELDTHVKKIGETPSLKEAIVEYLRQKHCLVKSKCMVPMYVPVKQTHEHSIQYHTSWHAAVWYHKI